jgi:hypothetical protein
MNRPALSIVEQSPFSNLAQAEAVIEHDLRAFVAVGHALLAIQQHPEWYVEAGFATFEDYMQGRWQFSRFRGYEFRDAALVVDQCRQIANIPPPRTEGVARELVALVPSVKGGPGGGRQPEDFERHRKEIIAAWKEAQRRADGKPTASIVRVVVQEKLGPKTETPQKDRWICYACAGRGYVDVDPEQTRGRKARPPDYHGPTRKALMTEYLK